jgi:hypothetical protein
MTVTVKYTYNEFKEWAISRGFNCDDDFHELFHKEGFEVGLSVDGRIFHAPKGMHYYRQYVTSLKVLEQFFRNTLRITV